MLWSLQNRPQIPKRYYINPFLRFSGTFRLRKGNFYLFSRFLSLLLPLSNTNLTLHFRLHPPASSWQGVAMEILTTGHCDVGNFQLFPFQCGSCVLFTLIFSSHRCVRMTTWATTLDPETEAMECPQLGAWLTAWSAAAYSLLSHLSQHSLEKWTFCHFLLSKLLNSSFN